MPTPPGLVKVAPRGRVLWSTTGTYSGVVAGVDATRAAGAVFTSVLCNGRRCTIRTAVYDPEGLELRSLRHDHGFATAQAVDRAGGIYLTGVAFDHETGYDILTVAYTPAGALAWSRELDVSPVLFDDEAGLDVAVSAAGSVAVVGVSDSRLVTVLYGKDGTEQWLDSTLSFGGRLGSAPVARVAFDPAGNVIVSVLSYEPLAGTHQLTTVKYGPAGEEIWVAQEPAGNDDLLADLAVDDAGNVFVAATFASNYRLFAYDPTGARVWDATYDSGGKDTAVALGVDAGGTAYVTGTAATVGRGRDILTVAYLDR